MSKIIKAVFNTRILMLMLSVMLAASTINSYVYPDEFAVNIEVDGVLAKTVSTDAETVENILRESNIAFESKDQVNPALDTKIVDGTTINVKRMKSVVIHKDGAIYGIDTVASTTKELVKDASAIIGENDSIVLFETGMSGEVVDGGNYVVKPAFPVNVYADCATYPVSMAEGTVAEAIELSGVTVHENDIVVPALGESVAPGMEIKVTRVAMVHDIQNIAIPAETEYRINKSLKPGEEVLVSEGSDGEMVIDNVITYHDGNAVSYVSNETVIKPAVNTVVECGVWNVRRDDQNAAPAVGTVNGYAYSKVISAKATAYCDDGKTASGIQSKEGVVAVDPRVIPLGTRLYIEATDGSWSYGVCLAGDTGGLIKGNRVDLFYDEYDTCIQFGRRNCNIYILAD